MEYTVYKIPPQGFHPTVEVAGCFCESGDRLLLLKRHPDSSQGNTWGIPAGKVEQDETPRMGAIREVREESGLDCSDLQEVGKLFYRLPHIDYIFHMFYKKFETLPEVTLRLEEHLEMRWVTFEEALQLPLIDGAHEALNCYKQFSSASTSKLQIN